MERKGGGENEGYVDLASWLYSQNASVVTNGGFFQNTV